MAQTTKKTTISTVNTELSHTTVAAATKVTLKNRFNSVIQWAFNSGIVANGGNVIGPYCVIKDVPIPVNGDGKLYFYGFNTGHAIEAEYNA